MSVEDELARLEKLVLGGARVSAFRSAVEQIRRMLARRDPRAGAVLASLTAPAVSRDLAAAIAAAFSAGVSEAAALLGRSPDIRDAAPAYLVTLARKSEREIAADVARARALAKAGQVQGAWAAARSGRTRLERAVASLVNGAGNAGVAAVAGLADVPLVWVAETDACVTCLAYSGLVAQPGGSFPGGLSYGSRSSAPAAMDHPPAHPNCRCTVEPLNSQEYADALRREADRSVLRGFSLSSESMSVRIDAARRLLAADVDAPKSVIAFARRAVAAGKFPTRGRP